MKIFSVVVYVALYLGIAWAAEDPLRADVYSWDKVDYERLPFDGNTLIGKYPYYIPENNDIIGVNYHAKSGLMLATVGRFFPGVPSSLNAFCGKDVPAGTSAKLWGFPDYRKNAPKATYFSVPPHDDSWSVNNTQKRYAVGHLSHYYTHQYNTGLRNSFYNPLEDINIVSVYRTTLDDRCNRVFAVDSGVLHYSFHEIYDVQKPSLLVFDIPDNGCITKKFPVLRKVEIPDHLWKNPVGFVYVTVDYQPKTSCDDVIVYITNILDNSVVAYDYQTGDFWNIKHHTMNPVFHESTMDFDGQHTYDFPYGISNVVLGFPDVYGNRVAFFSPVSSSAEYAVSTRVFKNAKDPSYKFTPKDFTFVGHRGCGTQAFRQVLDLTTGVMFFGDMQLKKIRCWNTQQALSPDTVGVVYESELIQSISDMNLDSNGDLWFHTSHLPLDYLIRRPLNTTIVNSRSFKINAAEVIRGTVCDTPPLYRREDVY
ncbi:hypothetical protein DMENIID0001_094660 [Sergentomyia squamirostris]